MYLEREDHVTGLIRLLSVGLRVLTLLEFVVRRRLAADGGGLGWDLHGGSPRGPRPSRRPNASWPRFRRVTLTIIHAGRDTLVAL